MAITARTLLHGGAAGTIEQGVADVGGISFGPWEMVTGFFADILAGLFAALAGAAHLLVLPLEVLWQSLVTVVTGAAGAIASGLNGLWQHVTGFFAHIVAGIAGAAHLLVLPLETVWQWLATAVGAIASGLNGLWQHVTDFFAHIIAGIADAAHLLVLPLETLWQWLATSMADAAGAIASGFNGLWQHVTGFFDHIVAGIAGAAHLLVLPLETLWQWLATSMADAVGAIGSALDGPWQLVAGFLPGAWAALVGAAHEIPRKLAELWRWIQAAAPVALPYVLVVAAVVLVAALVCFCWPALLAAGVGVGQALVIAACHLGHGLFFVCSAVGSAFTFLLPPCMQCLNCAAGVTMNAPGAAGMLISRAAFEAAPALFFALMRAAPPIVAATVFCTETVALLVATPVAALFGVRR